MADVVQYRMERMVDELDDLERRGLFTRREIDEIVRKRRDFEFRLKRHSPLKEDFVAYIEFEKQLEALRNLRKRAIIGKLREERKREEEEEEQEEEEQESGDGEGSKKRKRKTRVNKGGKLWKRSISDVAGVLRILDIYRKVTTRYKGDLELWFKYLEFCREQRHGTMKKVLVQAIRYHPKVPGLWMYAAAWEFDHNLNVAAARALMQSGLRTCPESEDMWIEYLRMELTYLNKLKARKVALGEDVKTLSQKSGHEAENKKWKEENKELFMPLSEEKEGSDSVEHEVALEKKENFFWEQGSNILRTIYHGAAEALPSNMSLRKRFLEILAEVDLAHSDELKEEVMEDIRKNFSKDEDYWDWFAKFQLCSVELGKKSEKGEVICWFKKSLQVYEDALKSLPSTKMFSLYGKFLYDAVVPEANVGSVLVDTVMKDKELSTCLLKVYERAESSGCLTEELAHQYVYLYLHLGRLEEARALAGRLCDGKFSHVSKLWCLRISIEMKWLTKEPASLNDTEYNSVFRILRSALTNLSLPEAETLWFMALKLFSEQKDHLKKLIDCSLMALARSGGDSIGYSVPSAIVNLIFQREGIQRARETYKRFLALPRPSVTFFRDCIELESNLALVGDKIGLVNARKLYDSAVNQFPHNKVLWKSYYDMEIKVGTAETVNAVHWRARKAIGDTSVLSSSYYF